MTNPSPTGESGSVPEKKLGVFQIGRDWDIDIGVMAVSASEAVRRYKAEICGDDYFEEEPEVKRVPWNRPVRISWIDDKPTEEDVPKGGRIEPVPGHPEYLSIVATAKQWCEYYSRNGRDFFVMWEVE